MKGEISERAVDWPPFRVWGLPVGTGKQEYHAERKTDESFR